MSITLKLDDLVVVRLGNQIKLFKIIASVTVRVVILLPYVIVVNR